MHHLPKLNESSEQEWRDRGCEGAAIALRPERKEHRCPHRGWTGAVIIRNWRLGSQAPLPERVVPRGALEYLPACPHTTLCTAEEPATSLIYTRPHPTGWLAAPSPSGRINITS